MGVINDVKKESLYDFISQKQKIFEIPCFQRNYSWEKNNCIELYEDILNSYNNNEAHYLGNLLYYVSEQDKNKYILIDGQQRITTIFLMLCAMRDTFNELENINDEFLYEKNQEDEYKIKLKQNFSDANYFEKIIAGETSPELFKSKSKIVENYKYFKEKFENTTIDIKKFYDTIKDLEIINIKLASNDLKTVQVVFEKINSTGKGLSSSDLIRNLLLLSNNIDEQNRLHKKYWIILERILANSDISQFSRNYLILKKYKDIQIDEVYRSFKEYFYQHNISAEKVLKEMIKYAKFYSMIKNYELITEIDDKNYNVSLINLQAYTNKENQKLEKNYKKLYWNLLMLNKLNTDQQYPFFLQLFDKLFDNQLEKLNDILDLFVDFMIRYRIVGAYGGGGALSSAIYDIMKKIDNNSKKCNYEDILFELSNSPTPASAFPTDGEFKKVLKSSVNSYGKILLYKLEYKTKNIPVDLNEIQIEHLMPQTLDANGWWLKNLGGTGERMEERAKEIHNTYLNCLGNIALISQGYNLDNSNHPWDEKRENLKKVQFTYTNSCAKYTKWRKNEITDRNEKLANKACELIKSPLERTRPIRKNIKNNVYAFSEIDENEFSFSKPLAIIYDKVHISITNWYEVLPTIFEINKELNIQKLEQLIEKNIIHKRTKKCLQSGLDYDPIISNNADYLTSPIEINLNNFKFYVEGYLSSKNTIRYAKQILEHLKLINKYSIEIEKNQTSN